MYKVFSDIKAHRYDYNDYNYDYNDYNDTLVWLMKYNCYCNKFL